jgi:hypothetical protein
VNDPPQDLVIGEPEQSPDGSAYVGVLGGLVAVRDRE